MKNSRKNPRGSMSSDLATNNRKMLFIPQQNEHRLSIQNPKKIPDVDTARQTHKSEVPGLANQQATNTCRVRVHEKKRKKRKRLSFFLLNIVLYLCNHSGMVVWSCLPFIRSGLGTVKGGGREGRQRKRWEDDYATSFLIFSCSPLPSGT